MFGFSDYFIVVIQLVCMIYVRCFYLFIFMFVLFKKFIKFLSSGNSGEKVESVWRDEGRLTRERARVEQISRACLPLRNGSRE